jgi:2-keto-4-pentenoate hydratase/2-oxohepta-3-ene-1,7-dioic acid hydratase in catechol pathway
MAHWLRFERDGRLGFGTLTAGTISVHTGDMFAGATATGETIELSRVRVLTPCAPTKIIALWNNLRALGAKLGVAAPDEPLYLLKSIGSALPHGGVIKRPASYPGKVVFEGELGIVIGRACANVSEAEAEAAIFGYTCINDVTAADILNKNPTFPQWARAKSFDTFGVFGPVIATGLDPMGLTIKTVLNGEERQNYPVTDMFFPPRALVAALSKDMTLLPGDLIMCGTSVGVGVMKEPQNLVEVTIDGIGTLRNTFAA